MSKLTLENVEREIFEEIAAERQSLQMKKTNSLPVEINKESWLRNIALRSEYSHRILFDDTKDLRSYICNYGNISISRKYSNELLDDSAGNSGTTIGTILNACSIELGQEFASSLDDRLRTNPSIKIATDCYVRLTDLEIVAAKVIDAITFSPIASVNLILRFNMYVK